MKKNQKINFDLNPTHTNSKVNLEAQIKPISNIELKQVLKEKVHRPVITSEFIQNIKNNILGD